MPLSHIKVIDLARARSGPTCVRQLSEMGAQVIKVEALDTEDDGTGARHEYDFQNIHPNKRSMTLNLKDERGKAILFKLVEQSDVLVENFRPDVKFRLGIDYETLAKVNPRLVYGSISGFGQTGPYRERPGLDQIAQGLSGLMTVNGEPGRGPMRVGLPVADLTAGFMLAHGIGCAHHSTGCADRSRDPVAVEAGHVVGRIAELYQDLVGVLAVLGGGRADARRRRRAWMYLAE